MTIAYLNEHQDVEETKRLLEKEGRRCLTLADDVGSVRFCTQCIDRTLQDSDI